MLVLSRKEGDRIRLYSGPLGTDSIEIVVTRFNHGQNCVGIGIDAPKAVVIERDDTGDGTRRLPSKS